MCDGETLVVLGPSGAGKTSLLRLVAGLESPDGGSLNLDGRDLLAEPAHRRGVALVFQDDTLFPHLSVFDNLAFGMRGKRNRRSNLRERIDDVAQALDIAAHLRKRPAQLSGGERQRAALARAVLSDPRVLLLDEPFAHLDPQLRLRVRREFVEFRRAFTGGAMHVTHDHLEAMTIADRLAVMIAGEIVQIGIPQQVYDFPASVQVARFFGSPPMNLLSGEMDITGIRPEHVVLDERASLRGRIAACESTGADTFVRAQTARGEVLARLPAGVQAPFVGDDVGLAFDARFVRRFDPDTGALKA